MKGFDYSVPMPKKECEWMPRITWLFDTLGNQGHLWTAKKDRYWFKKESDLVMYLLRWA